MSYPRRPLRELLDVTIGGVWGKAPGESEVDVRVVRVTELKAGGRLDTSTAAVRSVSRRELAGRRLKRGDLLLEKSGGGPKNPVGRVGLVMDDREPMVCANFMQLMRPNPRFVDPRYLHLYLNHFHSVGGTAPLQTASTNIRNIKASEYVQVDLPAPTLEEQRRIVEILEDHLSRLNGADAEFKTAQARVAAFRQAALERSFGIAGAGTTLGELIVDISAGKSFGSASAAARPDEWGIIKVSAMTWGAFDETQNKAVPEERVDPRFEIRPGDLLVSRANTSEYVGASVLVREVRPRLLLSDKSLRVIPRPGVSAEWLWRTLQSPSARRQISALATGTKDSMRNISQSSLRAVRLPLASPEDQGRALAEFAGVEAAYQRLTTTLRAQMDRSVALRRAILAAAFEGKLTGRHTDIEVIEEVAYA